MLLQSRHEIPDVAIELLQTLNHFRHFLEARFIHRSNVTQMQLLRGFDNPDRMRVSNLAATADIIHAVIELVAYARVFVESFDQATELLRDCSVLDLHFRQTLNEVEPRPRCIERRKYDSRRRLIRL